MSMVVMPENVARLLVDAAKYARYSGSPDPEQVRVIELYEEQIKASTREATDNVGHPISLQVKASDGDVSLIFTTVSSFVEIPTNYLSGPHAVAVAGQLAFLLGIKNISINTEPSED